MNTRGLASLLLIAFAALAACSSNAYENPCPTQGAFVVDAALNGSVVTVDGYPPLSIAGVGACAAANPSACQPATQHLTLTLQGATSPASDVSRQLAVHWADAAGGNGSCKATIGHFGFSIGSIDGSVADSTFCDLVIDQCASASFDSVGLRIGTSGPYAHLIEASVSQSACCWQGSAVAQ